MEKPKQVNITRRLRLSFCVLISIFILFSLFSFYDIQTISSMTRTIYDHPLVVSNAALQANVSITKMHRNIKDVVLFKSPTRIQTSIENINQQEQLVYQYLDIVRNTILGDEGKVFENEAKILFDAWRPIREEVISLVRKGQKQKAAEITIGKCAEHVAKLEEKMLGLTNYARNKASSFMSKAEETHSRVYVTWFIFLLFVMFASSLIAFFTLKRVALGESALRESEEKFRNLFNNAETGMFRTRIDGSEILDMNEKFLNIFGRTREEMQGSSSVIHWADPSEREEMIRRLELEGRVPDFECKMLNKQGEVRTCLTSLRLYCEQGLLEGSILDISERKQAEDALRESIQIIERIINAIPVRVFWKDKNLVYLGCNALFAKDAGFADPKEIIGEDDYQMGWRDQAELYRGDDRQVIESGDSKLLVEEPQTTPEGSTITLLTSKIPLRSSTGEICGVLGTYMDITERKQDDIKIKASLKEKEVLLSEIHHRVKNNMQVIISLLKLQAEKIEDKNYANMLQESQNRILSMALLHEQLYMSKDFANIDFSKYVKSLLNGLFISHGIDTNKVKLNIDITDVSFDIENAIPCGLIINELVSNSLKHAFPRQREGNISIILQSINEDELELTVSDDGVGIPEDLDVRAAESMGLHIVRVLAEQTLEGKMELNRTEGTRFHFQLKRSKYQPRI